MKEVDGRLLVRVRDYVASNDPAAVAVLDLLEQFSEHLKEEIVGAPSVEVEQHRGAIMSIRRYLRWVNPAPITEHDTRNSYIPEQ